MEHTSPQWLRKAIFYEVYPQSFQDSNGDGIGDLPGLTRRLGYLQELGVNALWLNPIFCSTFFDAGYDVTDYRKVDPRYGGNEAFFAFLKEAHALGFKVLLDLVPGHTSFRHPWFLSSSEGKDSPYADRYIWTDSVWKSPKNYGCLRGCFTRDGAALVNFFSIQPALNYGFYEIDDPAYQESYTGKGPQKTIQAMEEVIRFWLDQGVDGFRVDMAGWLVKNDPESKGTSEVWKKVFHDLSEDYPEAAFVSEWANPELSLTSGFDMDFLLCDEFHPETYSSLTRYDPYFSFHGGRKSPKGYLDAYRKAKDVADKTHHYAALISGNHDERRMSTLLSREEAKFSFTLDATLPGVFFLYYGDELGLKHVEGLKSVEGGYNRTGDRTPMPWDSSHQAGFTTSAHPYIPLSPESSVLNVEAEEKDPDSLLNFTRKLLSVKKEHVALENDAAVRFLPVPEGEGKEPLLYVVSKADESILIALNPDEVGKTVSIPGKLGEVLLCLGSFSSEEGTLTLAPESLLLAVLK